MATSNSKAGVVSTESILLFSVVAADTCVLSLIFL